MPDGSRNHLFGAGGGQMVADSLTRAVGSEVPLLGQVPLDPRLRETGDAGTPLVLADRDAPAAVVLREVADRLATRSRGLAGRLLSVSPSSR
jgi:ATP-binding protein involved in chromosome partitioning